MKILIAHNHYGDYAIGGEAAVMHAEVELLRSYGHNVLVYERTNSELNKQSLIGKINTALNYTWSKNSYNEIRKVLENFKPDVFHVHNYKWLFTPSIFAAAKDLGIPTVHTLHNYWMAAPCASLMKYGKVCELCLEKNNPKYILKYKCRKEGSLMSSLLNYHYFKAIKKRKKLSDIIDVYISLTNFAKKKYVQAGIPSEKIFVKPNFLNDPFKKVVIKNNGYALFVGRVSFEKGVSFLVDSWKDIDFPLKIVGDGPEKNNLNTENKNIEFLGWKNQKEVYELLSKSSFFIFPSLWYEGFPISLLEAMAMGKPIIASNLGARNEMIQNEKTGLLYDVNSKKDFTDKCNWIITNKEEAEQIGKNARKRYLDKYNPESNYKQLIGIYEKAINNNNN